jgi:hypothetical protein
MLPIWFLLALGITGAFAAPREPQPSRSAVGGAAA